VLDHHGRATWLEIAERNMVTPPPNPEQAADDERLRAASTPRPKADAALRVITAAPERQDGLAVTALVVHEDALSLHFHHLREPRTGPDLHASFMAFRRQLERLTPPVLRDDQGNTYTPWSNQPAGASADSGGIIAYWLYTPPAPPTTRTFTVQRNGSSWTMSERK
jgi:hypothetical protein